jgi:hypothetical protein
MTTEWYYRCQDEPWSTQVKEDATSTPPKTLSVPEAGRLYFNLGRNASYEAARRGDIPTVQLGRIVRAPVVALERMLEEAGQTAADQSSQTGPRTTKRVARGTPR